MALSAEQRESLNRAKLNALARLLVSDLVAEPVGFPGGAMLVETTTGDAPAAVFALLDGGAETPMASALGGALAKAPAGSDLHLLVEAGPAAGTLARMATSFAPAPKVFQIVANELEPAVPSPPGSDVRDIPADDPMVTLLREGGAELVVEGGVIVGEIQGLEVGRIGVDHDGEPRLHVGVGAYDQEAFVTINPEMTSAEGLRNVVDEVRRYRRPGADPHPINRLVRERWIRSLLMAQPDQIGLRRLSAVPSFRDRNGLRDMVPASAMGTDRDGALVAVLCSAGVDFGLIPAAAEVIARYRPDRVVLAVPPRDQYPHLARNALTLRVPTVIVDAPVPWA